MLARGLTYTKLLIEILRQLTVARSTFWLIWFINQRALYNHELSMVVVVDVGVSIAVVVCAHLPLAQELDIVLQLCMAF